MIESTLPSLHGTIPNAYRLRTEIAKAISHVQLFSTEAAATKLQALFDAAATETAKYGPAPVPPAG